MGNRVDQLEFELHMSPMAKNVAMAIVGKGLGGDVVVVILLLEDQDANRDGKESWGEWMAYSAKKVTQAQANHVMIAYGQANSLSAGAALFAKSDKYIKRHKNTYPDFDFTSLLSDEDRKKLSEAKNKKEKVTAKEVFVATDNRIDVMSYFYTHSKKMAA